MNGKLLLGACLAAALTGAAFAQPNQGRAARGQGVIRTTGEAVLQGEPDRAVVRLGVETRARQAEQAAEENSAQSRAVIDKLKAEIGDSGTIHTANFSIREDRRFDPRTQTESSGGFVATNTVVVRFSGVDRTGEVLDEAIQAGANQVQSVSFEMEDDGDLRNEALAAAARDARSKAEVLASSLGLSLGQVISVEDSQPVTVQPFQAQARMEAAAVSTVPIEVGSVEVRAVVSMTHAIER